MGSVERYACAGEAGKVGVGEQVQGIAGKKGAYALYSKGQAVNEKGGLGRMVCDRYDEKVWEHTVRIFDDVKKKGKTA